MGWGKDKWRLEVLDVRRRREEEQGAEGEEGSGRRWKSRRRHIKTG